MTPRLMAGQRPPIPAWLRRPPLRKSARKADHVVRRTLADGSVKEYRYPAQKKRKRIRGDTLGDMIDAWQTSPEWNALAENTRAGYSVYTRPLMPLKSVNPARIEKRELVALRNEIATYRGNGAATGFMRATSALFGWAVENGWLKISPCAGIKRLDGGHLPAWTQDEAERAIAGLSEPLRRAVILALYTGQRRGDLIALPWSAYDGRTIRLKQEKTGETLVIACHPALKVALDAWRQKSGLILRNGKGNPWRPANLSKQLQIALAKIDGFPAGRNIHGLRKLAAANLAQAGCTLHEIAAITGHRSLGMLQLYTQSVDQERLAEAAIARLVVAKAKRPKTEREPAE